MTFRWNPACTWYSYTDVEKIVQEAIAHTTEQMLARQLADLDRLQAELDQLDRSYE